MVFRRWAHGAPRAACLIAAMAGTPAVAQPAAHVIYAVVRVGSALADDDRIGVRRAGLACLPNGMVRWSDVATGTLMDQREAVQDALEDAGVAVTPLGSLEERAGRRTLRLRATIRAADFRLCAKHWIGDAKAYSGDAALDIEWRVESGADGSEVPHLTHVARHVEGATIGAIYRRLLGEAAQDAAHWLQTPQS